MKTAMRNTYGDTLARLGATYKNIVVLDADLAKSTQTARFGKVYPERFFDMGIAEQDMMATAAGLAVSGMNVFASTFAMFGTGRCWEQIRNSVAYPNIPVKIVVTHAGISVGEDGPTHQACEDIAIMRAIPNMKIISPVDSAETEKVIEFLADYFDSPVYVRLARMNTEAVFDKNYKFKFGKGYVMKEGNDLTIISTGTMLFQAMAAHDLLAKKNVSLRVIHMPSIKPIDSELIVKAAKETGAIMTIEEHSVIGGLGSAVSEVLTDKFPAKLVRMGMQDEFAESGTPEALFEKYGLTEKDIVREAMKIMKSKMAAPKAAKPAVKAAAKAKKKKGKK
jgi:transketolase